MDDSKVVQDMLYRIRAVNKVPDEVRPSLLDFQVDGIILGKVRQPNVSSLLSSAGRGSTDLVMKRVDGSLKIFLTTFIYDFPATGHA
jgi:hypothetical protein